MTEEKKDWLCNKCDIGVLDPKKKTRSDNTLEFGVVCPECGQWNPTISFTADDLPSGSEVEAFMSASSGPIPPGVKAEMPSLTFGEHFDEFDCGGDGCREVLKASPTISGYDVICPKCGYDNGKIEIVAGGIPGFRFGEPDTGIMTKGLLSEPKESNYTFIKEGKEVGKLWRDEEDHLRFEGQLDISIQIFMQSMLDKMK